MVEISRYMGAKTKITFKKSGNELMKVWNVRMFPTIQSIYFKSYKNGGVVGVLIQICYN